jgi:cell division protein FtsZ
VSDASTIVQEAADEDANIIFGAVVDPALEGMVKITVIATGFGPSGYVRPLMSGAQTPIDMSQYADVARRSEAPAAVVAERFAQGKVAVGGRRGFELPSLGQGSSGPGDLTLDRDFEMNSTLDVPAFLRKQEG